jgi:signal transduction histidine kinase
VSSSGLGLTIAKEIVELHRGKIWAESNEGEGSTFLFAIPRRFRNVPESAQVAI